MTSHIGCSGWKYDNWQGTFYKRRSKENFQEYSSQLKSVEINATFYRTPSVDTCRKWFNESADDFAFVLKGPRRVTHVYRLNENSEEPTERFLTAIEPLQHKLKCVLWQFPPSFRFNNFDRIRRFGDAIHNRCPNSAFEFRHASWMEQSVLDYLISMGYEYVRSDHAHFNCFDLVTNSRFAYYRLHGPNGDCHGSYTDERLAEVAARMEGSESFAYFNNDIDVGAPYNAVTLRSMLEGA